MLKNYQCDVSSVIRSKRFILLAITKSVYNETGIRIELLVFFPGIDLPAVPWDDWCLCLLLFSLLLLLDNGRGPCNLEAVDGDRAEEKGDPS